MNAIDLSRIVRRLNVVIFTSKLNYNLFHFKGIVITGENYKKLLYITHFYRGYYSVILH